MLCALPLFLFIYCKDMLKLLILFELWQSFFCKFMIHALIILCVQGRTIFQCITLKIVILVSYAYCRPPNVRWEWRVCLACLCGAIGRDTISGTLCLCWFQWSVSYLPWLCKYIYRVVAFMTYDMITKMYIIIFTLLHISKTAFYSHKYVFIFRY